MRRVSALALFLFAFALTSHAQEGGAPAAGSSTPAATSSASAATPTSTSSSAGAASSPGTTTAAGTGAEASGGTPASESTGPIAQNPGESDADYLARVIKTGTEQQAEGEDDEDLDLGEGEGEGEEKTEGEDAEPTADDVEDVDPYAEGPGPLPPKELNAKIAANPALKAAIDADPEFKNSLFAASRLAAEASEFKSIFTNTEEAKVAAAANAEYTALTDLVTSIEKPEDAQSFYGKLMELSILHDDDGNPIIDQKSGKPVSDGTVGRLIHHTGALFLNHFGAEAQAKNDDELAAAVEVLKARAFGGPASTEQEGLTEQQRAAQQQIDSEKAALAEQKRTAEQTRLTEFNQRITSGIDTATQQIAGSFLANTDLPEGDRGEMASKIIQQTYERIAANPQFHREQDALMRRVIGPKTEQARIDLGKKWFQATYLPIARKIAAEAGAKVIARQSKQQQQQAARVEASRSEAPGSLRTSKAAPTSAADRSKQIVQSMTERLGRAPKTEEVFAELLKG